jgi:hypothetical protein
MAAARVSFGVARSKGPPLRGSGLSQKPKPSAVVHTVSLGGGVAGARSFAPAPRSIGSSARHRAFRLPNSYSRTDSQEGYHSRREQPSICTKVSPVSFVRVARSLKADRPAALAPHVCPGSLNFGPSDECAHICYQVCLLAVLCFSLPRPDPCPACPVSSACPSALFFPNRYPKRRPFWPIRNCTDKHHACQLSFEQASKHSAWETLGLKANSSTAQIKKAYRKLVML